MVAGAATLVVQKEPHSFVGLTTFNFVIAKLALLCLNGGVCACE